MHCLNKFLVFTRVHSTFPNSNYIQDLRITSQIFLDYFDRQWWDWAWQFIFWILIGILNGVKCQIKIWFQNFLSCKERDKSWCNKFKCHGIWRESIHPRSGRTCRAGSAQPRGKNLFSGPAREQCCKVIHHRPCGHCKRDGHWHVRNGHDERNRRDDLGGPGGD